MTVLAAAKFNYRARIERAELLAQRHPSAQEMLTFYVDIARMQRECYESLPRLATNETVVPNRANPRSELNPTTLVGPFARFLGVVEIKAPAPLSEHAREWSRCNEAARSQLLAEFWKTGLTNASSTDQLSEFLARAFLQPYAEYFQGALSPPVSGHIACRCPSCSALPLLGVLRPEGDGGKRFLQCSFCLQEWEFRRIFCANCGEDKEQNLPVYVADQFPHVRVECCETCKHFLRTVDLTKDGHAVPPVDDLAAIPLTLWAHQNGYTRIQNNLLGT